MKICVRITDGFDYWNEFMAGLYEGAESRWYVIDAIDENLCMVWIRLTDKRIDLAAEKLKGDASKRGKVTELVKRSVSMMLRKAGAPPQVSFTSEVYYE